MLGYYFNQCNGFGVARNLGAQHSLMYEANSGFERSTSSNGLIDAHSGRFIFPRFSQPTSNGPDRLLDDIDASLLINSRRGGKG